MKRKLKLSLEIVLVLLLLFYNCRKDPLVTDSSGVETVSSKDALRIINELNQNIQLKSSNQNFITGVSPEFTLEEIINSEQYITVVNVTTQYDNQYSRLLLLKIDNEIKSIVFSMVTDIGSTDELFSGEILITDTSGKFYNGYRVKNGIMVSQLQLPSIQQRTSEIICAIHGPCTEGSGCILCTQSLNEVVLNASPSTTSNTIYAASMFFPSDEGSSAGSASTGMTWDYGGGGSGVSTTDCPEGYIRDTNGNCIKVYNPCDKISTLITNANVAQKIESLNKPEVFNQKFESGLTQNKNGLFTALETATSTDNSKSLYFNITEDTQGYIHAHTNDYTIPLPNDSIKEVKPIRMFSPSDVNSLMLMASHITDGNYSNIYGIMLSSTGNYIIKFTGTSADIKTGFETEKWRKSFEQYKIDNEYWSNEKLFLRFLSEKMQVQGVSLFKIKDNGTIEQKYLDANKKVQKKDCL